MKRQSRRRASPWSRSDRQKLVETAKRVALAEGPSAVTVADVARIARLPKSVFYRHFRSREELMSAVSGVRASDAEREAAAETVRRQYVEGRLTLDELHDNLGRVYGAQTVAELCSPP